MRGARKVTGETIKAIWVELSTLCFICFGLTHVL